MWKITMGAEDRNLNLLLRKFKEVLKKDSAVDNTSGN